MTTQADCITGRARPFTLGVALTLVLGVFAVAVPFTAYLCRKLLIVHQCEILRGTDIVLASSPWLPLFVAVAGLLALLMNG